LVLAVILASCSAGERSTANFYPVDSLITEQVKYLSEVQATLTKHGEIDGVQDDTTFVPVDATAWLDELDIFMMLEAINKPINRNNYRIEDGLDDPRSNLTIKSITSKTDLPIAYLKIFYQDTPSKLRKIEAVYREENALMKGSRRLIMEFLEFNNKNILISYSIEGGQKMFLGDSVEFLVMGTITIN
jgi:hypothetical protein